MYQYRKRLFGFAGQRLNVLAPVVVVNDPTLKNILLPVIPHKEQQRIIEFIKEKCTKIDGVLHDKELQLEKAKAEKYALIYEYVTGKKTSKGGHELCQLEPTS